MTPGGVCIWRVSEESEKKKGPKCSDQRTAKDSKKHTHTQTHFYFIFHYASFFVTRGVLSLDELTALIRIVAARQGADGGDGGEQDRKPSRCIRDHLIPSEEFSLWKKN